MVTSSEMACLRVSRWPRRSSSSPAFPLPLIFFMSARTWATSVGGPGTPPAAAAFLSATFLSAAAALALAASCSLNALSTSLANTL